MTTWKNRIIGYGEEEPDQLLANPKNWRIHPTEQQEGLQGVLDEVGYVQGVIVNRATGFVVDGHMRVALAMRNNQPKIPVTYVDLTPEEEDTILSTFDPIGAMAATDRVKLKELIDSVESENERVNKMMSDIAKRERVNVPEPQEEDEEPLVYRVPDAVWGTDNIYGIPMLDLNMQADHLEAPFMGWGTKARKNRMTGTYHFYVDDSRFEQVWRNPIDIANSACYGIVEPNFSVYTDMPKAVALWQMFRKRWISRWLQSIGIRIFVDLNIAHRHDDLRFIGVPEGWKSYCTRAYSERLDETVIEYEQALKHAGDGSTILFVCYGGGKKAEELAREKGWIWYPDQQTQYAGGN